ncbi:MAG: peptide chain release factor N(5)-glutamine methyltransferase [Betaproteobacteria bacterium]|nr:peptide chain release factor N(5)-glutamine methyltransferase [Betaproteobacteria bacterium]
MAEVPQISRLEELAILEWVSGKPRSWLLARSEPERDAQLTPGERALAQRLSARRVAGEPLAYLLGFREFYGHRFWVNAQTLIPRSDTELLVDEALALLRARDRGEPLRVLELGTGSGCIIISIALAARSQSLALEAVASDIHPGAAAMARNNARWHGIPLPVFEGSWCHALPQNLGAFDLIVSNPPYVGAGDPHLTQGDLRFEPPLALVGQAPSADGLADLMAIGSQVGGWLAPGGHVLVEHGTDQQEAVMAIFENVGFRGVLGLKDLAGRPRAVRAHL